MRGIMSGCLQQRQQAALAVQGHQIITTAHVFVTDEDLRHGAPSGEGHHAVPLLRQLVNANLFDVFDTPRFQELFGPNAIRTNCGGEHLDWGHGVTAFGVMEVRLFQAASWHLAKFSIPRPSCGLVQSPAPWPRRPLFANACRWHTPE